MSSNYVSSPDFISQTQVMSNKLKNNFLKLLELKINNHMRKKCLLTIEEMHFLLDKVNILVTTNPIFEKYKSQLKIFLDEYNQFLQTFSVSKQTESITIDLTGDIELINNNNPKKNRKETKDVTLLYDNTGTSNVSDVDSSILSNKNFYTINSDTQSRRISKRIKKKLETQRNVVELSDTVLIDLTSRVDNTELINEEVDSDVTVLEFTSQKDKTNIHKDLSLGKKSVKKTKKCKVAKRSTRLNANLKSVQDVGKVIYSKQNTETNQARSTIQSQNSVVEANLDDTDMDLFSSSCQMDELETTSFQFQTNTNSNEAYKTEHINEANVQTIPIAQSQVCTVEDTPEMLSQMDLFSSSYQIDNTEIASGNISADYKTNKETLTEDMIVERNIEEVQMKTSFNTEETDSNNKKLPNLNEEEMKFFDRANEIIALIGEFEGQIPSDLLNAKSIIAEYLLNSCKINYLFKK